MQLRPYSSNTVDVLRRLRDEISFLNPGGYTGLIRQIMALIDAAIEMPNQSGIRWRVIAHLEQLRTIHRIDLTATTRCPHCARYDDPIFADEPCPLCLGTGEVFVATYYHYQIAPGDALADPTFAARRYRDPAVIPFPRGRARRSS